MWIVGKIVLAVVHTAHRKEKIMGTLDPSTRRFTISDQELYERIADKAYELYQQRGEVPGHDLDDWLVAERDVHDELLHGPLPDVPERAAADYAGEEDRV
jgi:hypothetical protein